MILWIKKVILYFMKIRNFTPHPINICNDAGEIIRVFQPEGLVRLKAETASAGTIDGVRVSHTVFGKPEGLPEPSYFSSEELEEIYDCYTGGQVPSVYYIVSQLVKSALTDRTDLLVPAEVVRDSVGNIVGCKSLGF